MPSDLTGLDGKVADTLNELASLMERSQLNLLHLRNEVGRKGRIGERMLLENAVGGWAVRGEAVNSLVDDLTRPTIEMGRVIGAGAKGGFTQKGPVETNGRPL